jgi:hypothetical protein
MSNELAVRSLTELNTIARTFALTGYFDAKGNSELEIAKALTKILAGQEMGFGPYASITGIHIIQGKPTVSANLMAAAVKRSGRYDYRVRKMDDAGVDLEFYQKVSGQWESIGFSRFSKEDATKAGTQNMAKYGRNMMFARAMSNGVRWYCPDIFDGPAVYTPEELGAEVNGDGEYVESTGRVVDAETGEINPEPQRILADQIEAQLNKKRRQFHAVGTKLYGKDWDIKRPGVCKAVSGKVASHTDELTPDQLDLAIAKMQDRIDNPPPAPESVAPEPTEQATLEGVAEPAKAY